MAIDEKTIPSPKGVKDPDALGRQQQDIEKEGGLRRHVSDHQLRQPNERDTAPDSGVKGTDPATDQPQVDMPQAHEDVERGLVDTGRGVPSDVPSSRTNQGEKQNQAEKPDQGKKAG